MEYAALVYPHQNLRYRESLLKITKEEIRLVLHALGWKEDMHTENVGEAVFICFEMQEDSPRARNLFRQAAGVFLYFQRDESGLQPVMPEKPPYLKTDFPSLLKYKGKTNEMFTNAMISMALSSSTYSEDPELPLTICDPMGGKGTTAMLALCRGCHGISLEINKADVKECADYTERYLEFHRMKFRKQTEGLTIAGHLGAREICFEFADTPEHYKCGDTRKLRLIQGDTMDAGKLLKKESVHLMVTDLPYGVQKSAGENGILETVEKAMPGWVSVLKRGGVLAVSFNTHVTKRHDLERIAVENGLAPVETENLEHWVEQAISRDVLLARK